MIGYAKVNSEKLLILGCGDLGRRLAAELAPAGYQATGVRRHPPEDSEILRYRAADTGDVDTLETILAEGFDVIVVTMTPSSPTSATGGGSDGSDGSDEKYRKAYVQTCENLVAALDRQEQNLKHDPLKKSPRLILYVSSSGVYGQSDGEWVDEDSETDPKRLSGERLLEAEAVISRSGFAHCILRFSGIYGPGRNRLLDQVRQGRATLSARYTNRIHAEDCVGVMAHLIERQRTTKIESLYLASDSEPAPMAEVVNWLSMQLKTDKARFAPGENNLGKRCRNQRLLDSGYKFRYPDYREGYAALLKNNISPL